MPLRRRAKGEQRQPLTRSELMARVGPKDTTPELAIRRLLHRLGYRFQLHRHDLPGTPDIVFQGRRKVIFVHGCFWHRHPGCKAASTPKTRVDFWAQKFHENVARDARKTKTLEAEGWGVAIVWSCETKNIEPLASKLSAFLGPSKLSS